MKIIMQNMIKQFPRDNGRTGRWKNLTKRKNTSNDLAFSQNLREIKKVANSRLQMLSDMQNRLLANKMDLVHNTGWLTISISGNRIKSDIWFKENVYNVYKNTYITATIEFDLDKLGFYMPSLKVQSSKKFHFFSLNIESLLEKMVARIFSELVDKETFQD